MAWSDPIIESLRDDLGAAPMRLLRAIFSVAGEPSPGATRVEPDKGAVLAFVAREEAAELAPEALRQRVKAINTAAKSVAKAHGGAAIAVTTRKTKLIVDFAAGAMEEAKRAATLAAAVRSTRADTDIDANDFQEPRAAIPRHRIFVSHGWEDDEVEKILDGFLEKLKIRLGNLPEKFRDKFTVELWFDRANAHGRSDDFEAQTDAACKASALALFIMSDKWHASPACRREAAHFKARGTREDRCFLRIQLSGNRADGDADLVAGPVFPGWWNKDFPNLLTLWGRNSDAATRDEFVVRLRDEICRALDALTPPPGGGGAPEKKLKRLAAAALGVNHFEEIVRDGEAQEPHAVVREGEEGGQPLLPILLDWACGPEEPNRLFSILGSFGAGKTTAVQLLARALDERRATDPSLPFPIYLDFRRLIGLTTEKVNPTLIDMITTALNRKEIGDIDARELVDIVRRVPSVVIFDGLDEVGTRLGSERASALFRELLEIVPQAMWTADRKAGRADWQACPTRLLVTCRTHFFRDVIEQESMLRAHYRHGGLSSGSDSLTRTLYMAPFALDQIRDFFSRQLGEVDGARVFRDIEAVPDLIGLAAKPIMTRYIAELAPHLAKDIEAGRPVNVATVYDHLFRLALERDGDKRPLMSIRDRHRLLGAFAHMLWQKRASVVNADDLEDWFDTQLSEVPGLRALLTGGGDVRGLLQTELRNASLLIRSGDEDFGFVHTSFQEYFLARRLLSLLLDETFATIEDLPPISRECFHFLVAEAERLGQVPDLVQAAGRVLTPDYGRTHRTRMIELRGAILERGFEFDLPEGADLSDLDLTSSVWSGTADRSPRFVGISFRDAELFGAAFTNVTFDHCDFAGTVLSEALFDGCTFSKCHGAPLAAISARHYGTRADEESFEAVVTPSLFRFSLDGAALSGPKKVRGHIAVALGEGHDGLVCSAVFSSDGVRLATASDDNTARIWDTQTGRCLATCKGHDNWLRSAVFSPDGARLATASDDKTARIWDTQTGKFVRGLQGLPNAWICFEADGITAIAEEAWKYLHGIATLPNGRREIVCPSLSDLRVD